MTKKQLLRGAACVHVSVEHTEYWIKVTKAELYDMAEVLGWDRLDMDTIRMPGGKYHLYVGVEPT